MEVVAEYQVITPEVIENEALGSQSSNQDKLNKSPSTTQSDDNNTNGVQTVEESPIKPQWHKQKRFRNAWGNLSYANLIAAAILSSPRKKMKLNEIYAWFSANVPYFAQRDDEIKSKGWKNSIRHNLSLKREFVRESGDKKAGYWYIDKDSFLQRLHSENRQINDPVYNKDMEIFETFVLRAFANSDWADKYVATPCQNIDYKDNNFFIPAASYNPTIIGIQDINCDLMNVQNQQSMFSNVELGQPSSGFGRQNSFQVLKSTDSSNLNFLPNGNSQGSCMPISSNSIGSSMNNGMDTFMVYSTNSPMDFSKFGPYQSMNPNIDGVNGDNLDFQPLMFQNNLNQNQLYAFTNYGVPMQSSGLFRDNGFNGGFLQSVDNMNMGINYNPQYSNNNPFAMKPNQFCQSLPFQTPLNGEVNKPLVN